MKPSLISFFSSLFALIYLLHTTLAIRSLNLTNATIQPATSLSTPREHEQIRVPGTHTTLNFHKYGPRISPFTLATILEKAQYQVAQSLVRSRGDGPIAQPTFEWRHGRTYVRVQQQTLGSLTWGVLSQALHGLLGFDWFLSYEFTVTTDEEGAVGEGSVGLGYN